MRSRAANVQQTSICHPLKKPELGDRGGAGAGGSPGREFGKLSAVLGHAVAVAEAFDKSGIYVLHTRYSQTLVQAGHRSAEKSPGCSDSNVLSTQPSSYVFTYDSSIIWRGSAALQLQPPIK